ncbi:MAG: hypothetical protein HQL32_11720 [Planctomycetes bacterium]|nr:hypothetical protein [Planctomycetota bacterium]
MNLIISNKSIFLTLFLLCLSMTSLLADSIRSSTGTIGFDVNMDGNMEMMLNRNGLGLGVSPSTNLHVQGKALVSHRLSIGGITNHSNLHLNGSIENSFQEVNSDSTIGGHSLVLADSSSGNLTLTLPYAANVAGGVITIKKVSLNNEVTILGGGNMIDQTGLWILSSGNMGYMNVISSDGQWWVKNLNEETTISPHYAFTIDNNIWSVQTIFSGNYYINWGDGSFDEFSVTGTGSKSHNYASSGEYTIRVSSMDGFMTYNLGSYAREVTKFEIFGQPTMPNRIDRAFREYTEITSFPDLDTSGVTNFAEAFYNCKSLTTFPVLNTSNGTNFKTTWRGAESLTTFPTLDVSNGQDFRSCWLDCKNLSSFPLLNFSSATRFDNAWDGCLALSTFPANSFDVCTAVTNYTDAFTDTALTAGSIENILVSIDAAGASNGTLGLSGGTSAANMDWTISANIALSSLLGKGWTVDRN